MMVMGRDSSSADCDTSDGSAVQFHKAAFRRDRAQSSGASLAAETDMRVVYKISRTLSRKTASHLVKFDRGLSRRWRRIDRASYTATRRLSETKARFSVSLIAARSLLTMFSRTASGRLSSQVWLVGCCGDETSDLAG